MGVDVSGITAAQTEVYSSYNTKSASKTEENATSKTSGTSSEAKAGKQEAEGVVYEKSDAAENKKATYTINKMSAEDRAALVQQLKADEQTRRQQLADIVQQMLGKQATAYTDANDMWKFLAKGDFTVDEQTKLQAQKDIAEDGYYGIAQTSQRLFDFASALAGDDVDKMKEMQEAVQKGFQQATKAWGKDLPEICQKTLEETNKKFEDYYASKSEKSEEAQTTQTEA